MSYFGSQHFGSRHYGTQFWGVPGEYVAPEVVEGLADPYVGKPRFQEPFDRGYYIWRYGDPRKQGPVGVPEDPPAAPTVVEAASDIDELDNYIHDLVREVGPRILAREAKAQYDETRIAQLERDLEYAREALALAKDYRRRRQNQAAIAAAITQYYH